MKRTISMLLTLVLLLGAFACTAVPAAQNTTPKPTAAPAAETPQAQAPETEALETEAPATEAPAEPQPVVLTDMIGREVTVVPGTYSRVVCIGAGALRMFSYAADVNLLCGVEDIDNTTLEERPKMFDSVARPYMLAYGDVFATLPSCGVGGPNAQAAEAEKILACDPDIVISEYEDVEKEDALEAQLGVPVVTLKSGSDGVFDERFFESLRLLGTIFASTDRAEALISFIEAERAEIERRTADIADEEKPSVYLCGLGNWGTTNHLMTAKEYILFTVANVKNAVTDTEGRYIQAIEEEKFVAIGENMDLMIIDAAAVKNIKPLYAENPAMFDTCKAWQNGEVYLEMAYNAYYTNYEIALMNAWFLAKTVYPERFADIDMTAKTDEITNAFFGQSLAEQIFAAKASFGGYQKIDTATFFN